MNKVLLAFLMIFGIHMATYGQVSPVYVVKDFVNTLSLWCQENDIMYRRRLDKYESVIINNDHYRCFVSDDLAEYLKRRDHLNGDLMLASYLNGYQKEIPHIRVEVGNISMSSPISYSNVRDVKDVRLVSCTITISGSINYILNDVFYVYKDKILAIDKYVTRKTASGREEIVVKEDLLKKIAKSLEKSDFFIGGRAGYSKLTPVNLSIIGEWGNLGFTYQLGGLVGSYNVEKEDVLDKYKIFYCAAGPNLSIPYATFNCGIGFMIVNDEKIEKNKYNYISESKTKFHFLLKPSISIDIPITEDFSIGPYAAYNYVPTLNDLNTWEFGIGFKIVYD